MSKFKEGNPGRPKGAINKITRTVKETVLAAFNEIQSDPKVNIISFAKTYPRDFYAIAAKLIPTEITGKIETKNTIDYSKLSDEALNEIINASRDNESESREV
jgi:hypothetical protein